MCKTLYSLLQDSPDEQELFGAMGHVANSLLGTGEENVQGDVTLMSESRGDDCATPSATPSPTGESTPPRTPSTLSSLAESASVSTSANRNDTPGEDSTEDTFSAQTVPGTTDTGSAGAGTEIETSVGTELAAQIEDSFEQAMANAGELEEKWFLTFEQFVGALQREPFLCQFFAEQNSIDLSGTSVDPVLNPYTRTILATTSP